MAGIKLYANNRIHLKVWLLDEFRLLATSANITDSALGATTSYNYEFLTDVTSALSDVNMLKTIKRESVEITDINYLKTKELLETVDKEENEDFDLLENKLILENLVDDLPITLNPQVLYESYVSNEYSVDIAHDLERLKIPYGLNSQSFFFAVDRSYFRLPIVLRVCENLAKAPIYFGEMKGLLQAINDSDPKPTRRELTSITQNLYRWLVFLRPEIFIVDQPNYSERISMTCKFIAR